MIKLLVTKPIGRSVYFLEILQGSHEALMFCGGGEGSGHAVTKNTMGT